MEYGILCSFNHGRLTEDKRGAIRTKVRRNKGGGFGGLMTEAKGHNKK